MQIVTRRQNNSWLEYRPLRVHQLDIRHYSSSRRTTYHLRTNVVEAKAMNESLMRSSGGQKMSARRS